MGRNVPHAAWEFLNFRRRMAVSIANRMKSLRLILRHFTIYTLLASVSGMGVCPAASEIVAATARVGSAPSPGSNDHLPCRCDRQARGCGCGAACSCQVSVPQPKPVVPSERTERQTVSRQVLALQAHAARQATVELASTVLARTISAKRVALTPTLQLEHVRIQT